MVHICRKAETLRLLHPQIVGEPYHRHGSSDIVDVKVLVEGLRGTETVRVAGPEIHILRRIETEVDAGAENDSVNEIVLVQPSADENAPFPVLPLILGIQAPDSHYLVSHPVIAPHIVIEIVLIVFQTDGKVRRHEQASVELVNVLAACHPGEIIRLAICIRVLSGPVIAVPGNVLGRCEHVQMMVLVRREPVETQASGIDSVLDLLGYHCLVRREIDIVATAAELVKMVILGRQLAVNACLQIGTHPDSLRLQPRQLGESVPVAVIAVLVPHLPENGHAHLVVIRYEGGIEGGVVVQGGGSAYAAQCMGCGDRVSGRLLCDDVDGPGNGGRAEQCRPAAPHYLDTVHYIGRNLLDAINSGKGAEDWP